MRIILGSSSPFRKILLKKLQIEFETFSPEIDETQNPAENPEQLVQRLTIAKAHKVAEQFSDGLIISSDQVAVYQQQILGKPGDHESAVQQLSLFSGQSVQFITGMCLFNAKSRQLQFHQDITLVKFRHLNQSQINHYLLKDQPYQCAGSFRAEGLGCALFKSIESNDPNALIGLPLIRLVEMLADEGVDILG